MRWPEEVSEFFQSQCERYPDLQIGDMLNAMYQSVYGCGHLMEDSLAAVESIRKESAELKHTNGS